MRRDEPSVNTTCFRHSVQVNALDLVGARQQRRGQIRVHHAHRQGPPRRAGFAVGAAPAGLTGGSAVFDAAAANRSTTVACFGSCRLSNQVTSDNRASRLSKGGVGDFVKNSFTEVSSTGYRETYSKHVEKIGFFAYR